ncbi:hypothetical protein, partial [Xanthomonas euvesicatoria]|uniref:hypothetical protein n=1 Tax=Xanthomonas euvesicatoria TaxID=456327 RepID=UPI002404E506
STPDSKPDRYSGRGDVDSISAGVSASMGWVNECEGRPNDAQLNNLFTGPGLAAFGAYGPFGGAYSYSPGAGSTTEIGVGTGVSITKGRGTGGFGGEKGEVISNDGWGWGMVKISNYLFFASIFACVTYGIFLSLENSRAADLSGKPGIRTLKFEIDPFVQHFGGMPINYFDRVSIAGVLSSNIRLSPGKVPPLADFRSLALKAGWIEVAPVKSSYSFSYRFCKKRMMLLLEHSYKSHWIYGIEWVSDKKGVYYCKSK